MGSADLPDVKAIVIWKDRNDDGRIKWRTRDTAAHTLEIFSQRNPFISIHDGSSATFKLGVAETDGGASGVFKIVSMSPDGNAGDPCHPKYNGLAVDVAGQIGLGTDAPTARLHVVGSMLVEGDVRLTPDDNAPIQVGQTIRLLLEKVAKLEQEVIELCQRLGE